MIHPASRNFRSEVLRELEVVTGRHEILFEEVHPKQFFGIEIKPWAREIAELVLWIRYHQFWRANHTYRPQEPILENTGTIECRDAVLARDDIRHDRSRDEFGPTPQIKHPVTGRLVPDPKAKLPYMEHLRQRPAEWPPSGKSPGRFSQPARILIEPIGILPVAPAGDNVALERTDADREA